MLLHTISILSIMKFGACVADELPIVPCKRNVDDYPSCIKHSIEDSWPRFSKGVPEYDLPPLDPFFHKYQSNEFNSGEIKGRITAWNITCIGLANSRFLDVKPEFFENKFHVEVDMYIPYINCDGNVEFNANIVGININTSGHFYANATGAKAICSVTGHVRNDTLIIDHFNVPPTIETANVRFTDLFEGNEDFNNLLASLINQFWPPIYRVVMQTSDKQRDQIFTDYANTFFSKVPFSKLFPLN